MMKLKYRRARMLEAVIHTASIELGEPIDRIEVLSTTFAVWAGTRRLILACDYGVGTDERGVPVPGSGHWVARVVQG